MQHVGCQDCAVGVGDEGHARNLERRESGTQRDSRHHGLEEGMSCAC